MSKFLLKQVKYHVKINQLFFYINLWTKNRICMKYMVYGIWYMVYGIWYMVYGIYKFVYKIKKSFFNTCRDAMRRIVRELEIRSEE